MEAVLDYNMDVECPGGNDTPATDSDVPFIGSDDEDMDFIADAMPADVPSSGGDNEDVDLTADTPGFKIGDSFQKFEDLEKKLKEFESFRYVKFWKREARTVEAAKNRVNRYINPQLKYYQLKYTCIHGGQVFRPKGKGHKSTS